MCEPITMTIATAGLTALSTGAKAITEYRAGKYEEGVAAQNRQLALAAAGDARIRGEIEAGRIRTRGSQMVGAQRLGYAAGGVDVSSGSALQAMADTRMMSELDAMTARNNAAREAWGYQVQATNYAHQQTLARKRRQGALIGTILGGAGSIAGSFGRMK